MGELVCSQQCLQSIACLLFSQNLKNKEKRVEKSKEKKQKNKEMKNLGSQLTLWFSKSPSSSFSWFEPIGFPCKIMPCKLNHNLICLGLEPSSKGLEANLKFLTNRNVRFHWTLFFEPLFKVALSIQSQIWLGCVSLKSPSGFQNKWGMN